MPDSLLDVARAYVVAGLSVIPIAADGSKRPDARRLPKELDDSAHYQPTWKPFQKRRPTDAELRTWFGAGTKSGIAVLGGAISGGLEVIDFDAPGLYEAWLDLVRAETWDLVARLTVVRTPRGHHVYYRCGDVAGNTKLAEEPDPERPHGRRTLIETRGEGGYVLAPGCPAACHPSGGLYEHSEGPALTDVQTITAEHREILWAAARAFQRVAEAGLSWDRPPAEGAVLRPGDLFNQRATWPDALGTGWEIVRTQGAVSYWRRPGKDGRAWSATTGHCRNERGEDLLFIFSANAHPFAPMRSYSKFAAYTLTAHAGDYKAAARALAGQGYGAPRPAPVARSETPPPAPPVESPRMGVFRAMRDVASRDVEWLWRPWLPLGAISLLDGDPGLAKSTVTLDLAARVSRGWAMPPGRGSVAPPASVLLLSAEDDPECTLRPRLDAADADVSRVHFMEAVRQGDSERPPILPFDLDLVEGCILDCQVRLVVVDPFLAYLDGEIDAHKDQQVRSALHRIALLVRRTRVALLLVRHLNKLSGGPAMYRGGGSIGIIGASRTALVVGRDPDDDQRRVLAMNKSNLGPIPRSLAYTVEPHEGVSRIGWVGEVDLSPNDILWHAAPKPGRPDSKVKEAVEFLGEALSGGPVPAERLAALAEARGLSWRTLERAKKDLGAESVEEGGQWYWTLRHPGGR